MLVIGAEPALISSQRKCLATDPPSLSETPAANLGADLHPRQIFKENANGPCLVNTEMGLSAPCLLKAEHPGFSGGILAELEFILIKRAAERIP